VPLQVAGRSSSQQREGMPPAQAQPLLPDGAVLAAPAWLDSAKVQRAAGSRACSICGQAGHLRYACPVRVAALDAGCRHCGAQQRLAWATAALGDTAARVPRQVLALVAGELPAASRAKVVARAGLAQDPLSQAQQRPPAAAAAAAAAAVAAAGSSASGGGGDDGCVAPTARRSRKEKGRERRQRRQAEARAARHAQWDGLEKAERSAWFNANERQKRQQQDSVVRPPHAYFHHGSSCPPGSHRAQCPLQPPRLARMPVHPNECLLICACARQMAAAAAARAWTGADVVRVAIDMSYGDLMSLKELRSTAQQAMLCWAAVRRAARPCALSLTSVTAVRERHTRAPLAASHMYSERVLYSTPARVYTAHGVGAMYVVHAYTRIDCECEYASAF